MTGFYIYLTGGIYPYAWRLYSKSGREICQSPEAYSSVEKTERDIRRFKSAMSRNFITDVSYDWRIER